MQITNIPVVCKKLLQAKGLVEQSDIAEFLFPKLKNLPKPEMMKGVVEAAKLVRYYMENDLQIVVWGDYDVDGTTSTGLLVHFFKELGANCRYHIPNRLTEGYGLNIQWFEGAIKDFSSKNFLLITVDCGIANSKEIERIKTMGGDVIVTDHHSIPQSGVPECVVINPSQPDCGFFAEKLAGVGVAFYLAAAIRAELSQAKVYAQKAQSIVLKNYLVFVALGTVADLVEITDTNRILIRAGLESLQTTKYPGVQALLSSSGLYDEEISTEDIGFLLGPKINAAGRLGKSNIAIELFLASSEDVARKRAESLDRLNQKRKNICEDDFEYALGSISKDAVLHDFLCVCSGEYHLGVAGIVASRLVEEFHVPTVVFAEVEDKEHGAILKGSIRSIEGISVIKALNSCSEYIMRYGGHDMAAGLTVRKENLAAFRKAFSMNLKTQNSEGKTKKRTLNATVATVDEVMDESTLKLLAHFEPFGPGNEAPIFLDRSTSIVRANTVGRLDSHLNLVVRGKYSNYKGIGFNLGDRVSLVQDAPERTIYFAPTKNRYRGTVSWQLRVVELL